MFYIDTEAIPKPSKEILEKCHTVVLTGSRPHLKRKWAQKHCQSFVYMDWSNDLDDYRYIFYFYDEADKIMFALKYS